MAKTRTNIRRFQALGPVVATRVIAEVLWLADGIRHRVHATEEQRRSREKQAERVEIAALALREIYEEGN